MTTPEMALDLQAKVGSIIVHVDEGLSAGGSHFDLAVVQTMIADPDVQAWLDQLRGMALLPVKR